MIRRLFQLLGALLLLALGLLGWCYWQALQPPIVRRASIVVADWPAGEPARTVLLISDTHVAGPDMPPERLAGIMDDLNGLKPDLVVLAGDYISRKAATTHRYTVEEAVAPLGHLKAPLGVVAVLGNHDHWVDAARFRRAFQREGIALLANSAIKRGPFIIGGVDDAPTHHADLPETWAAMAPLGPGPRLILSHAPQIESQLLGPVAALLVGHTHCGQMTLPEIGFAIGPFYPRSWSMCGERKGLLTTRFIAAGLGTSVVPLRLNAPADVWLIRFGPPEPAAAQRVK